MRDSPGNRDPELSGSVLQKSEAGDNYRGTLLEDLDTSPEEEEGGSPLPFPVVAIGASAGGVEAYIELFKNLPPDTGMAFIVMSHLAPDQKSHLTEILQAHTKMAVREIQDGKRPEENVVDVLPPNSVVTISGGVLHLTPRDSHGRLPLVIDLFFRSLAADQRGQAIGVVLSGMDSDGAQGLLTIKGEGGISIVQAPESARFPGMPRNSINADHVDLVVPPAGIADELARLGKRFSRPEFKAFARGKVTGAEEQPFARILRLLGSVGKIDFRLYKPGTLRRRIARRMMLRNVEDMAEYGRYLQTHNDEVKALHEDVLISVTRFFRDPDVFAALHTDVLPVLLQNRTTARQLRMWVAGCSSGEEVYSLAITALEFLKDGELEPAIQIFGTDASESQVERARIGIYPESIAGDMSQERLGRFFLKVDKGFQVSKRVRDLCIFARQNLIADPPFSNLDLITCRNVLIYFSQGVQNRILPTFHHALRPHGFLILGHSEAIPNFADLFTPLNRKNKIYVKLPLQPSAPFDAGRPAHVPDTTGAGAPSERSQELWNDIELQRAADRLVLIRYGPPGVVVNEQMEILQTRGHTGPFLEMAPGTPSLHLPRMLREDIAAPVVDALRKSIEEGTPIRVEGLAVNLSEMPATVHIEVFPIRARATHPRCFLVLFTAARRLPPGLEAAEVTEAIPAEQDGIIDQARHDPASAKRYLQSLVKERDSKNQELISANEEIQTANEELQSANEELETAKEELQSANEELQTVNEELQTRNAVLTHTSNDLSNLLNSVNLPLLMLNNDLQIRQFTPPTLRLMNVRPTDIGRPISDMRLNLSMEDLEPILRDVLETLGTRECEVQDREGRWRLLRVRPYRTADNKIEGVVMILVDIDDLRRSQQELREARNFASAVIECTQIPLVVLSPDLKIRTANHAFRQLLELSREDLESRSLFDLLSARWGMQELPGYVENLQRGNGDSSFEIMHDNGPESNPRSFRIWGRSVRGENKPVVLLTIEEVTARRNAERVLSRLNIDLKGQVLSTQASLGKTELELRGLAASLFTGQEEERRRVARELHDDITQKVVVLEMEMERFGQMLQKDQQVQEKFNVLREKAGQLSTSLRNISHTIHPSVLEDLGLVYALKALVEDFEGREDMPARFVGQNIREALSPDSAMALYRITQEALRNVVKHAGRTHVKVSLTGSPGFLTLQIADFGEGFDPAEERTGLGLISMGERARMVGGILTIRSALDSGTTITVVLPLKEN